MIERCREAFLIRMMCRCLKMSASGDYDWRERPLGRRAQANERLLDRTEQMHHQNDGVMGNPRIWEELARGGTDMQY